MAITNSKVRTPMLECKIIESIIILCAGGASYRELEGYLQSNTSHLSLKTYLFHLIDQNCISYGNPMKNKFFSQHEGFNLMYNIYNECIRKNISIEYMLITFERPLDSNESFQLR